MLQYRDHVPVAVAFATDCWFLAELRSKGQMIMKWKALQFDLMAFVTVPADLHVCVLYQ